MDGRSKEQEPRLADFEPELKKLQEAVSKLESGDLALEDAFAQWEAGCLSYAACRRILESAKARIESLAGNFTSDAPVWEPFEPGETDGEGPAAADRAGLTDS